MTAQQQSSPAAALARALGVSPASARDGGERAAQAMAALGQARMAGGGGLRQQHLATAQHHIASLDPARHRALVQHLQGHVLALQGRGADTKIAHVTPGEVVIPKRLQSPGLMAALAQAAVRAGIDPATLQVGARRGKTNPQTGHQEFDDDDDLSSLYDWDAYNAASQTPVDVGDLDETGGEPATQSDGGMPRGDDGVESITVTAPPTRSFNPGTPPMMEPTDWDPGHVPLPTILPEDGDGNLPAQPAGPTRDDFQRVKDQIHGVRGAIQDRALGPLGLGSAASSFGSGPIAKTVGRAVFGVPIAAFQGLDWWLGRQETQVDNGLKKFDQNTGHMDVVPRAK